MNYYYAAEVKLIVIILNKGLCPKWKKIELKLVGTLNTLFFSKQMKTNNMIVNNTIKTWKILCKTIKLNDRLPVWRCRERTCISEGSQSTFCLSLFHTTFRSNH